MKKLKKLISAMLSCAMALTMCAGTAVSVSAAEPHYERESQYEPGSAGAEITYNGSFEDAESLPVSLLLSKSYTYHQGNFNCQEDTADFYSFSLGSINGSSGRVAIKLEGIPSGHNYDLVLYDSNGEEISNSCRISNKNEIIRTPAISGITSYYLKVECKNNPDYSASTYRIVVDEYIETVTKSVSLSPTTLNASPDEWSTDAYRNMSSIPSDAVVISAKISAKKSTTNNAYNNVLRVKLGNNEYVQVAWASGDIEIPQLIGEKCSGYWYAGFKASELSVIVSGKPTYLGIVSMNTFKLTIEYEYDKLLSY